MLSDKDIINFFHKVNLPEPEIIRYPDIKTSDLEIDDCELSECNFILYEAVPYVGHWTILFYNNVDNIIEFFDPLAYSVDEQLEFSYHKKPELLTMMVDSDEPEFEVNEIPFQSKGSDTCGIWATMRYMFNCIGYSKEEFTKIFYTDIPDANARDDVIRAMYEAINSTF